MCLCGEIRNADIRPEGGVLLQSRDLGLRMGQSGLSGNRAHRLRKRGTLIRGVRPDVRGGSDCGTRIRVAFGIDAGDHQRADSGNAERTDKIRNRDDTVCCRVR